MQTIIEIRSHFGGWKVFAEQGMERTHERDQSIHYAARRPARRGEIRILSAHGEVEETIPFDERSDWGAGQQVTLNIS